MIYTAAVLETTLIPLLAAHESLPISPVRDAC